MLFVTLELLPMLAHSRWLVRRSAIAANPMLYAVKVKPAACTTLK